MNDGKKGAKFLKLVSFVAAVSRQSFAPFLSSIYVCVFHCYSLLTCHFFFFLNLTLSFWHGSFSYWIFICLFIWSFRPYSIRLCVVPVRCLSWMMEPRIWYRPSITDSEHSHFTSESIIGWTWRRLMRSIVTRQRNTQQMQWTSSIYIRIKFLHG